MDRYITQKGCVGVFCKSPGKYVLAFAPLDIDYPLLFETGTTATFAAAQVAGMYDWDAYVAAVKRKEEVPEASLRHKLIEIAANFNGHFVGGHLSQCIDHQKIALAGRVTVGDET